ncbi:MAG: TonB-dependent receptor [Bacteroidota bacterium]|nr:TonB-dependent receptor [Bacteroidota bacterium]
MKKSGSLARIFLLLIFLSAATFQLAAQKVTLSYQNVPFEKVLKSIKKQTGLSLIFSDQLVDVNRKVSINVASVDVQVALKQLLAGTNLGYEIENNKLFLVEKKAVTNKNHSKSSSKNISGIVTDENSAPIIGATISIEGSNAKAITDMEGRFSLEVPQNGRLQISYIGYVSKTVVVPESNSIKIALTEEAKSLDEIVVVGYGTMKKSDVNASIVSIKPQDLEVNSAPSITQMLSGRAAGLSIIGGSAQPGGGQEVLIRGAASVGAGNDPLYVIDGFPVSNTNIDPGSGTRYSQGDRNFLNTLNPNDIASIEILKDASATAIYGARGCNGVILITTKRGSNGLKVDYSGDYSVQTIAKRPEMLTAAGQMTETNNYMYEEYLMRYKAYPYGTRDVSTLPAFKPKYTQTEIDAAGTGTDWYGLITQMGVINQQNVSVSKGSDDSKVLFSLNYFDQQGVIKTSGLKRYSGRLNVDQKLTPWLDCSLSLLGSVVDNSNAALGGGENENSGIIQSALQYSPNIKAERDENGEYLLNPNQALIPNPLSFLDISDNTIERRWLTNAFMNIHFSKNASLKLTAGMDDDRANRNLYLPKTFMYGKGQNGVASINNNSKMDYLTETTFSYNKDISKDHHFNGILGYSFQQFNVIGNSANTYDFFTDAFLYNRLSVGSGVPEVDSWHSQSVMASYFGRIQYSLKDIYLFTLTGRVDGSDKFGTHHKYGFFPSGAFAWRAIQEPFMRSQSTFSDLKVRLSLGQTGNSNIGNNAYEYYAANGQNYYLDGVENKGVGLIQLANPDLKWETTTEGNLGIDFGLFKNRINGSVELFYKQISDILSSMPLMSNSILSSIPANIGKTESKGLEMTVNTYNLTGLFKWNTNFTFTSYKDKWLERNPNYILQPFEKATDPINAVYGFIPDGIMQPGEVVSTMPQLMPGQMKLKDVSKDGKIDNHDMKLLGVNAPKFTMGLNNTFTYKNFDLSLFLYSSVGRLGWSHLNFKYGTGFEILTLKNGNNFLTDIKDRWSSKNMTSTMPSGFRNPYLLDGQYAHEDASFLRLKNVTFGYNFKGNLLTNNHISNCRLYVDAQNLFTMTQFSGLDPEVEDNSAPYPLQRTFSIGLNLTLK